MKKKLFFQFLSDNFRYTLVFYGSIAMIIFYYKTTANISEIAYPLILASTVFIIHLAIEWTKYYNFNININEDMNSENNKSTGITNQQKNFNETLKVIQKKYLKEISKINAESNSYRYFFSQWLHNMKTPVSIISLVIQKIENEALNLFETRKLVNEIKEENSKLHNGLEQLLNILRMEEFVRDYEPEAVNIVESLKDIINSKKSLFIYNNVFPKLEYEDGSISVLTDEKWNKFMIEQLINNAVKYSAEEGKKKHVTFTVCEAENCIQLKITDEGIGIPKSDINRVFEPFFTGENGRKYREASGIGLYICSLLAKNLKHKIDIQSEIGKGTSATITYVLNN